MAAFRRARWQLAATVCAAEVQLSGRERQHLQYASLQRAGWTGERSEQQRSAELQRAQL